MKKLCIILGISILTIIAVILFRQLPTKSVTITPELSPVSSPEPIQLCYRYEQSLLNGFVDRAYLTMTFTGPGGINVTGSYRNLPAQTDSKTGSFSGTAGPMDPAISARTADVWWDSFAEGMRVTEQLRIVFGEGTAVAQFGEMIDRGDGVYVYKNPNNLTSGFVMGQVDCERVLE